MREASEDSVWPRSEYQIVFPWWLFLLIAGAFVTWVTYRGIELSATLMLVFGIAEVAIVLLLSLWGLFQPGIGGINFSSFYPTNARSLGGLSLAEIGISDCFSLVALPADSRGICDLGDLSRHRTLGHSNAGVWNRRGCHRTAAELVGTVPAGNRRNQFLFLLSYQCAKPRRTQSGRDRNIRLFFPGGSSC